MDYPKAAVIIGGPHDGERHDIAGPWLRLPIRERFADRDFSSGDAFVAAIEREIRVAEYKPLPHGVGGVKFSVWVPAEMSEDDAGKMVFARMAEVWAAHLNSK